MYADVGEMMISTAPQKGTLKGNGTANDSMGSQDGALRRQEEIPTALEDIDI